MLESGEYATIREIADAEKINESYVGRVLRLTLLVPDIVEAILAGRQPPKCSWTIFCSDFRSIGDPNARSSVPTAIAHLSDTPAFTIADVGRTIWQIGIEPTSFFRRLLPGGHRLGRGLERCLGGILVVSY